MCALIYNNEIARPKLLMLFYKGSLSNFVPDIYHECNAVQLMGPNLLVTQIEPRFPMTL